VVAGSDLPKGGVRIPRGTRINRVSKKRQEGANVQKRKSLPGERAQHTPRDGRGKTNITLTTEKFNCGGQCHMMVQGKEGGNVAMGEERPKPGKSDTH